MSSEPMSEIRPKLHRWSSEEVFQLIDVIKECEPIYNPVDKHYFNRPYVENIWRQIDVRFRKRPGGSLAKWTNLRISYRREYQSLMKSKSKPSWAYFDKMSFLSPYLRKKRVLERPIEDHLQNALDHFVTLTRGNLKEFYPIVDKTTTIVSPFKRLEDTIDEATTIFTKEEKADDDVCLDNETSATEERCMDDEDDESSPLRMDDDSSSTFDRQNEIKEQIITNEGNSRRQLLKRRHDDPANSIIKRSRLEIPDDLASIDDPSSSSNGSTKSDSTSSSAATVFPNHEWRDCPDIYFLLSLLPEIRMLNQADKNMFKLHVRHMIHALLYKDQ